MVEVDIDLDILARVYICVLNWDAPEIEAIPVVEETAEEINDEKLHVFSNQRT